MEHNKMTERKLVAIMLFARGELPFQEGKHPAKWPINYWEGLREKFKQTLQLTETELKIVDETLFKFDIGIYCDLIDSYL